MVTNGETDYGLLKEQQKGQDDELRNRRKQQLIEFYTDLGNAIKAGTKSVEEFAQEQTDRDLNTEAEAQHDPLTGLLNRRGFFNSFEDKLLGFRRILRGLGKGATATPGCLALLDLDNFGAVNKTNGDAFGDSTLQHVAIALIEGVRPEDPVSRFGGEEFLVFLPGASLEAATHVVERLRQAIPNQTAQLLEGFRQTASFGIVQFPDNLEEEAVVLPEKRESLFSEAYQAVIEAKNFAKQAGKNRTAVKRANGKIEVITPIQTQPIVTPSPPAAK